jgi:DNA-binding MarR family transcriptional regulator
MSSPSENAFDLGQFLPYLLNQAAEATSLGFQPVYRSTHGLSRTEWRIIANLGKFGALTAAGICKASHIDKTKVSRAVAQMEARGLLSRAPDISDGRAERLALTDGGRAVFTEIGAQAMSYDRALRDRLGGDATRALVKALAVLSERREG